MCTGRECEVREIRGREGGRKGGEAKVKGGSLALGRHSGWKSGKSEQNRKRCGRSEALHRAGSDPAGTSDEGGGTIINRPPPGASQYTADIFSC